ncbi:hypothetical protein [Aeromicrobium piscarium]|uniref:Uncharacterized protein n=1 Tax=Aeromicrobium piscarium TaxID=2590901 RepID=A0A554SP32_9ACTN|nr:hypothetical protein [Aeromicrobium piscarium]TSD68114.1 hypothetical protein FNM00_00520 [Aeromicrobium piscarium]
MTGQEYTPTERTYGHGSITLTHYPSSGRVGVVQRGTNAVMDVYELMQFLRESGVLAAHDEQIRAETKRAERKRFRATRETLESLNRNLEREVKNLRPEIAALRNMAEARDLHVTGWPAAYDWMHVESGRVPRMSCVSVAEPIEEQA